MDKKKLAFFIFGLISVILPNILICVAAGHLLELANENPKLCSKTNTINPSNCSKKDITDEITFIDKYHSKDNLKYTKNDTGFLKNMTKANIGLAVISLVLLLIVQIIGYITGSKYIFGQNNHIWIHNLNMGCLIFGIIFSIASFINFLYCYASYKEIFINHKKYNIYKSLFIASIVLDIFLFIAGMIIVSKLY